ncbi:MAG: LysM peptidoglycan-binding domain-containing protein [Neisseria sp.]
MASLKTLAVALAGLGTLSAQAHSQNHTANQVGMAMMRLNSSLLHQQEAKPKFGGSSLWANMRKDFRMNEVNPELVRIHENKFSNNSAYFNRTIERSKPYLFHITKEVEKRHMPAEIALLPFIESAFVIKAKSHVGASGLWQFMPATGRQYGLEQTSSYDGRHDVYAATDAALNYLEYLHGLFGDWSLALAAYNWGEGNVSRAVRRAEAQGLTPVYENLRMPQETRNYVPKLLAVRNLVNNPETFGMNLSNIDNKPYFKSINLDTALDLNVASRLANVSENELLALNPAFKSPVFIPKNGRKILLPVDSANAFERNLRNAEPETLLSWGGYNNGNDKPLSNIATETGKKSDTLNSESSVSVAKSERSKQNIDFVKANVAQTFVPVNTINTSISAEQLAEAKPILPKPVLVAAMPKLVTNDIIFQRTPAVFNKTVEDKTAPVMAINESLPLPTTITKIESPAANIIDESLATTKQPTQHTILTEVQTTTENPNQAVAINETLPLPTQTATAQQMDVSGSNNIDDLAVLAEASAVRISAGDLVRDALAKADAQEAKLAAARTKQQQRIEARDLRLAEKANAAKTEAHKVGDGDTLYNIAQRYDLSVADLITANNLSGSNIRKGQVLKIVAANKLSTQSNVRNVSYTVRQGDTLNTIASRFNVNVNDIRRWNRNTRTVEPGQTIKLIGS